MKKILISLCLFVSFAFFAGAEDIDPIMLSYKRNFIRASLTTKLDILADASKITATDMGPLFEDALAFVIANRPVLGDDSQLLNMTVISVENVAGCNSVSSIPLLWDIFALYTEPKVRIPVIKAFSLLGSGNSDVIGGLNAFLLEQLQLYSGGTVVDSSVVTACVEALGKLADESSFDVLFRVMTGKMDKAIIASAMAALNSITAHYSEHIILLIENEQPANKLAAFRIAVKNPGISEKNRGEIAEKALSAAINISESTGDITQDIKTLRQEAVREITALGWTKASPLVIQYFYQAQTEYKKRALDVFSIIEIINCLGVMGTPEAAQTLSIYLGLLNSETEQTGMYNEQIMLAVIKSLGELGNKAAFDYLLYVSYLNYPETIQSASRDALARLKW